MTIGAPVLSRRQGVLAAFALAGTLFAPGSPALAAQAPGGGDAEVTSRLGVSAGEAIADAPLGTDAADLHVRIPELFETAARLGVRIDTVSVGQGFFAADGELLSERDLDLVVTGRRRGVDALAATLGEMWEQSSVFIFHPAAAPHPYAPPAGSAGDGTVVATATVALPGGADALTDAVYAALVTELADGGHVRYAGASSLLFVANTGAEAAPDFGARMERVRALLAGAGVPSGPVQPGRATLLVADGDNYDALIESGADLLAVA